jgi:hypothetical protein
VTVTPPTVPFVRPLSRGDQGDDVLAVKRALSRAGHMQWGQFTRMWGPHAVTACASFQTAKGLKPTGTYHYATHEHLRRTHRKRSRTEWAFDALAIKIMREEDITPLERVVARTLDAVAYAIINRDRIAYEQSRPMPDNAPFPNIPYVADCSGFVTWAARSGGWAQDPNYPVGSTRKWDGYGFTGTLWEHGTPVSGLATAQLCDLVFYGRPWMSGGRAHVAILRERYGGAWYVGSHGSDPGPLNVGATYRSITGIRRYKLI